MRRYFLILFFLGFWLCGKAEVVINEVFYDAVGSDDGKEWLELYNNGIEDINLEGWILQAGGASFSDIYTFSSIVIRAGSFFLISEAPSSLSNLVIELGFENGGTATDGIRIINPNNLNSDTVLYDSPNINNLIGDSLNQSPCASISSGHSLSRISDGVDSNSAGDWRACSNPTPGTSNNSQRIVTLQSCNAVTNGSNIEVSTVILNLSTWEVHNSEISIKIRFNSELKYFEDLASITANDSVKYFITIENEILEPGKIEVEIINNSDIEIVDNLWMMWIDYENPALSLSEIMYYPMVNQSEWIEVKLLSDVDESEISILDATNSEATSIISGNAGDYIVVAEDRDNLLVNFSSCDSLKVFQADNWVRLNNNGDSVVIEFFNTVLDSVNYENNASSQGYSLEYDEMNHNWHRSNSIEGATPTEINSIAQNTNINNNSVLKIVNNLISIKKDKELIVSFNSPKPVNCLKLQLFDIRGKELNTINATYSNQYVGEYHWDGYLQGKYLSSGLYPALIKIKAENGRVLEERKILITINR